MTEMTTIIMLASRNMVRVVSLPLHPPYLSAGDDIGLGRGGRRPYKVGFQTLLILCRPPCPGLFHLLETYRKRNRINDRLWNRTLELGPREAIVVLMSNTMDRSLRTTSARTE